MKQLTSGHSSRGRAGSRPQHLSERFTPRAQEEAGLFAQAADDSLHESVPRRQQSAFRPNYITQAIVACLWRQRKQNDATLQHQQG